MQFGCTFGDPFRCCWIQVPVSAVPVPTVSKVVKAKESDLTPTSPFLVFHLTICPYLLPPSSPPIHRYRVHIL